MAVDSREKRFSMLNFGSGNHWHVTFEADGALDLDDRQHLLDCYSGIAFGFPVGLTKAPDSLVAATRGTLVASDRNDALVAAQRQG